MKHFFCNIFLIIISIYIAWGGVRDHKGEKVSVTVKAKVFNYPILKGKENNPVLRLAVQADNSQSKVKSLRINTGNSAIKNLKTIRVFYTGADSLFSDKIQYGESDLLNTSVLIKGNQNIGIGIKYFWVAVELVENCDLTAKLEINTDFIQLNNEKFKLSKSTESHIYRVGVAVRNHMDNNVHTYRIPALATTNEGTLLAIYDVRHKSGRDLQGDIDIGLSRSVDKGNTWEPMQIILDMGERGGLPEKFNGVSDASILVDRNSNVIYVAGLWMHGVLDSEGNWIEGLTQESNEWNHQWRNKGSQPGLGIKESSQFLITKSIDDGKTWSNPVNLTKMCKNPEWWLLAPAPGRGITLTDGTLVIPSEGRDENGNFFSSIMYSRDGGESWKNSNPAYPGHKTNECQVAELSDGGLMLNMRDFNNTSEKGNANGRAIAVTYNLGEEWMKHPTSNKALIEPCCMASIHRHNYKDETGETKSLLFFSNPNSKYIRVKQTIKISFNDGESWPEKYWIELDEGRAAGYSCLSSIDNEHIGILYEGSQAHMVFQVIDVRDFLNKNN